MIHNFWSFNWIIQRLKDKSEEYGIEVIEVSEYKTSSICPICGSEGVRRYRGLFHCPRCNIVLNADVVGVLNIARRYGAIIPSPTWDRDNGLVAQLSLLRWDRCRWEDKSRMKTQGMRVLEARITSISVG